MSRWAWWAASAAASALLAAGATRGAMPSRPGAVASPPGAAAAALAWHACRLRGLEHDAMCATLQRPLDPARPGGPSFGLHVALLPALARRKEPDPIFFFAGGPGQSAIALAGPLQRLATRLGDRRDIVLIDQRGTGHSAPLQCDAPSADEGFAQALDRKLEAAAMDACRVALQKLPWGDLRFYTTSLAAEDADAVRAAIGAPRVDVVGISYGTRVVLEYLRRYGGHVRRAVMDGVAPPDMALPESGRLDAEAAFQGALEACDQEAACARAYPGLAEAWRRIQDALPHPVSVVDPADGRTRTGTLTREALESLVRPALYQPALGSMLPFAISQAAEGRFEALVAIGEAQGSASPVDLSEGEHFSVICSEDGGRLLPGSTPDGSGAHPGIALVGVRRDGIPATSGSADTARSRGIASIKGGVETAGAAAAGARPRADVDDLYRDVCARWPRGDVPPAFYTIPRSAAPALLLSGGVDPVTPPRHAARVAAALGALARHVVVPQAGHGVLNVPCMPDVLARFIDAPREDDALAVRAECAAHLPRPLAFVPPRPALAASATNDPRGYGDDGLREAPRPVHSLASGFVGYPDWYTP